MDKIFPNYAAIVEYRKLNKGKIGLCHGCFEILHPGHIAHLKAARRECDILVVSITADEFVNKGKGRPIFGAEARADLLASLEIVDKVFVNFSPNATPVITALQPTYYIKGLGYKDKEGADLNLRAEKYAVESAGGGMLYTETGDLAEIHTTALLEQMND